MKNNYNRGKNYWNFTRFTEGQISQGTRHNLINLKIFNFFFREGGRGERRSLGFQKERGGGEKSVVSEYKQGTMENWLPLRRIIQIPQSLKEDQVTFIVT